MNGNSISGWCPGASEGRAASSPVEKNLDSRGQTLAAADAQACLPATAAGLLLHHGGAGCLQGHEWLCSTPGSLSRLPKAFVQVQQQTANGEWETSTTIMSVKQIAQGITETIKG